MSTGDTEKNISRIRTFNEDAARSRNPQNTLPITPVSTSDIKEENEVKTALPIQQEISHTVVHKAVTQRPKSAINIEKKVTHTASVQPQKQYLTLNDELAQVAKPHKTSILSDSDDVSSEGRSSGTIIRDTKRKRFRLIPAMIEATTSWFNDVHTEYQKARNPIHTVAKAEARISTIEKAVHQGENAPREDFKQVSQRLQRVERKQVSTTLTFKDKKEIPKPTWSSATEDISTISTSLSEQEHVTEIPTTTYDITAPETETGPVPIFTSEKSEARIPSKITDTEVYTDAAAVIQVPNAEIVKEQSEIVVPRVVVQPTINREQYTQNQTQVQFPIVIFIVVILCASVLGVGISYYWFVLKDAPIEKAATVYTIPSLIQAQLQVPLVLSTNRTTLLNELLTVVQSQPTVAQIYPTIPDEFNAQKPAPAEMILQSLEPKAPGSFIRSLKEVTFGGVSGQPFIILKTTSFDVGFAGMLEWEQMLSADLAPLFGQPVVETFDSSARTDTQVRSAFFKDSVANNKNIRLLLDETGTDRIVYTFINQNTILITTTRESLESLLPFIK